MAELNMPKPGVDYPRDLVEFHEFFPDEASCRSYFEGLRWPGGFKCERCGHPGPAWRSSRYRLMCPGCRYQATVTSGTIFEGTRKPLRNWLLAAWEITSQKYGASAIGVQRVLGLRSYETAWAWLQKFRRAMVRPEREQLTEVVEVDETYLGGAETGVRGRETTRKAIIAIAVELKNGRIGRIRLRHVPDVSSKSLVGFVTDVVEPGARIQTDGWKGYASLKKRGFNHSVTVLMASPEPAHILMPNVHKVAGLLKRWWLGTHQGAVSKEHLGYYLDEFTFRFNRRTSKARGLLFYRLLHQAVRSPHTATDELFRNTGRGRKKTSAKTR